MHKCVTQHALTEKERSLRDSALYIIDNLNLVTLALRLCDFKDISVAVESKHVGRLSKLCQSTVQIFLSGASEYGGFDTVYCCCRFRMWIEMKRKQRQIIHCLYYMMCGLLFRLYYEARPDIDNHKQIQTKNSSTATVP